MAQHARRRSLLDAALAFLPTRRKLWRQEEQSEQALEWLLAQELPEPLAQRLVVLPPGLRWEPLPCRPLRVSVQPSPFLRSQSVVSGLSANY